MGEPKETFMMSHSSEEIKETSEGSKSSNEMSLNVKTSMLDSFIMDLDQVSLDDEPQAKEVTTFTIHRVPQEMRVGAQYYTYFVPKYVSVGPVHWGNPELRRGEIDKLKNFRTMIGDYPAFLEKIIKELSDTIVTKAREFYEKQLVESLDDETLVRIMVLDGYYIIGTFSKHSSFGRRHEMMMYYRLGGYSNPQMQREVQDLLMLENQIPVPVLECLFDYVISRKIKICEMRTSSTFMFPAHEYLIEIYLLSFSCRPPIPPPAGPFHHLLHMFHSSLRPIFFGTDDEDSCWYWFVSRFIALLSKWWWRLAESLPCNKPTPMRAELPPRRALQSATQLLEAGVKFKKTQEDVWRRSVIDVTFRHGYIEIPRLPLHSSTISHLLNLLAFEKCMPQCGNYVTAYMAFMNSLIDTAKDVDLLVSSGVLENKLGSDEDVAHFFNTAVDDKSVLLKFEMEKDHYLTGMFKDLDAYCAKPRHRYRAKLERDYLSSPWSVISLIAGTLLLILTVIQTFMSVYSYLSPPKI